VTAAGIEPDPLDRFLVVALDDSHPALCVEFHKRNNIVNVDASMRTTGLPRFACVVGVFVFLNPYAGFGEQIHPVSVIPVHVSDDHIADVLGFESNFGDGVRRLEENFHLPLLEKLFAVETGIDKYVLTADDKKQLDDLATNLSSARGYILELTGGTDSVGDATYNYQLSQRRADAVANYLQSKYNIPPHKFYLVGIGKDQQVASDSTAAGRAKNRRVDIKLMSNMGDQKPTTASSSGPTSQQQ